jgi:hypothetical protein
MVLQALLALLAMLVPLAALAKLVPLAPPETPARLVHLAAANTAHQLVWLQVIKRRRLPSHAMRRIRRPLGRLVRKTIPDDLHLIHLAAFLLPYSPVF